MIKSIYTDFAGQIGVEPRLVRIKTDNTQAEILADNFLKNAENIGFTFLPTDMALVSDVNNVSNLYDISITTSSITLNPSITTVDAIHLTNWTGVWASDQTGSVTYTKIGRSVTLTIPQVTAAGNNTSSNISSTIALPSFLRPVALFEVPAIVQFAGSGDRGVGLMQIDTDGNINWGKDANFTAFDATTSAIGFIETTISYLTSSNATS